MSTIDQEKAITRTLKAIEAISKGKMVIMVDDEDRENEGDLVLAADHVTPEHINFMAKEARGLICLTLEPKIVDKLKLPMMGDSTKTLPDQGTAFTVSIEARTGVTTGISAADRARTIVAAIDPKATPDDLVVPGHIFPLKAKKGGVLERAGHTEGSVDLAKLANLSGSGVICEIMKDDGTMARMADLEVFAEKHDLPIVAIADLITYRLLQEPMVEEISRKMVKTKWGTFESILFHNTVDNSEHIAFIKGSQFQDHVVDVRVQVQRPLLDVFADSEFGNTYNLNYGMKKLSESDRAVFIYLSRSEKLSFKDQIDSMALDIAGEYNLPSQSTVDLRMHGTGAQIIRALGVKKMKVHTTSPRTMKGLSGFGLEVIDTEIIRNSQH